MNYAKPIAIFILFAISAGSIYAFTLKSPEDRIREAIIAQNKAIEETNKAKVDSYIAIKAKCEATASGSSEQIIAKLSECSTMEKPNLQKKVGDSRNLEGVSKNNETVKGYTSKHSLILTGSHDYRQYSARNGAGWKNNNPSGITWGVSDTLKGLWNDAGIGYQKGSLRPENEKGNYILFDSVEDGLKAKMISVRERWGNATVSHYLAGWGTDSISLSFDKEKRISDLSDGEFMELFVQQLKKETPGYISQLVSDKILLIQ